MYSGISGFSGRFGNFGVEGEAREGTGFGAIDGIPSFIVAVTVAAILAIIYELIVGADVWLGTL